MVSSNVVHTVGLVNWKNGARCTGRGMGTPVRPPVVWRNRTQPSPDLGLGGEVRIRHGVDGDVADARG